MIWSTTQTSISLAAFLSLSVRASSCALGRNEPDGWLCTRIIAEAKVVDGVAQHNLPRRPPSPPPPLAYPGTRDDAFGSVQIDYPELLMVESRQLVEHQVVCLRRHIDHRFLHRTLLRISLAQLDGASSVTAFASPTPLNERTRLRIVRLDNSWKAVARIGKNAL